METTHRLIRPFTIDDAEEHCHLRRPDVFRYTGGPPQQKRKRR